MADRAVELSQLDESQQNALQTYLSVTDQDPSAAILLLQRSQWNVQIAIAKFFDGEAPDPVEEARASLAASSSPRQSTHRETLLNGSNNFPRPSPPSDRDPAPRIVPQPENRTVYKPPLLLSIFLSPFNLIHRLFSSSLSLFGYLFPFFPRLLSRLSLRSPSRISQRNTTGRRPLSPPDTAARFIRELEEEYGTHSLHFSESGYAQAYDLAKKDLKFLLVVLISPEHDDTSTFVRETLLSSEVTNFLNDSQNNIILWGGNVQDSEAYQVASALNCTKFPFAALIVHTPQDSSTSMSTITRITDLVSPMAFTARMRTAIAQQSGALNRVRATRAEQQASRNLRSEQNSAYERSLAQDRERTRQRREAEAAKARAEDEARVKAEASEQMARKSDQWRKWRSQRISPEPATDVKDATRISIRMPSGERIIRKFASNATVEELYAFVECYDILQGDTLVQDTAQPQNYKHEYKFVLVSPLPRMVYDLDTGGTVRDRIGRSGNLWVEYVSEEEEGDEDES